MISFTSSVHSLNNEVSLRHRSEDIDTKIECVDSLVSLLGSNDIDKMSRTFLAMSSSPSNCTMMRQHHVVDILVKILHSGSAKPHPPEIRRKAGRALHNIVHAHPEQRQCKREAKILLLLEKLRMYSDFLKDVRCAGDRGIPIAQKGCCQMRIGVAMTDDHQEILICGELKKFGTFLRKAQCLKITQNVSFEFWHFQPIFTLLKFTCLVTLFDRKLQVFKYWSKCTIFVIFNELLSTQNVNVARFARNLK